MTTLRTLVDAAGSDSFDAVLSEWLAETRAKRPVECEAVERTRKALAHTTCQLDGPTVARLVDARPLAIFAARSVLSDRDAAEDVVQESYAKALRGGWPYDPERGTSLESWFGSLVRFEALRRTDARAKRRRAKEREAGKGRGTIVSESAADVAIRSMEARELHAALRTLPRGTRTIIMCRYFAGMSYDEIATERGLSRNSVGACIHRGLVRLREMLERAARRQG